jgi:hypothetical protein
MKARRIAVSTMVALGVLAGGAGAVKAQDSLAAGVHIGSSGRTSVDLAFFHNDLAPYGRWVNQSAYGDVFVPRGVPTGWRPYTRGHWVDTDYGWTWVAAASEPYGWATYHYGRWSYDQDYGWVWVPGTRWAPAWVDWQEGDNYVGWAPLPPTVDIEGGGFGVGLDLAPTSYVFVPENRFLVSDVASYCVRPSENVRFFGRTRNITNYSVVGGQIYNRSLPVNQIERVTGRRVQRYQVADLRTADPRAHFQGNRVSFFRPAVNAAGNVRTAERIAAESRRNNNAPARLAVRRGQQAQQAAAVGRNAVQVNRQAAASQRQQAANGRGRQQVQAQAQRQRIADRAQTQRTNQRASAQNQRQQIAARAQAQRGNQRVQARAERQQIAAKAQVQRSHVQANANRSQQRAQANQRQNRPPQQAARHQQQTQPHQQQAARQQRQQPQRQQVARQQRQQPQQVARQQRQQPQRQQAAQQQRPQRQQAQRPQIAQQRAQRQQPHGKPPANQGQPNNQRRGHGGI